MCSRKLLLSVMPRENQMTAGLEMFNMDKDELITKVQERLHMVTGTEASVEDAEMELEEMVNSGSFPEFMASLGYTRDTALGAITGANALRKLLAHGWVNKVIGGTNLVVRGALVVGGIYLGVSRRRARKAAAAAAAAEAVLETAEAFAEAA